MKQKIELINSNYYDVTYDENEVAVLMVFIGNHDDMLSQVNLRLKEKSDDYETLKIRCGKLNKNQNLIIDKIKTIQSHLRGDYVAIHIINELLTEVFKDNYSVEMLECQCKHMLSGTNLEQENNKLKYEVNYLNSQLKTLRTFVCDSLKNNDKNFCIIDFDNIDTLQELDEILLLIKNHIKSNKNITDDQEENEDIHKLKKLRRMQWDKKPIDEAKNKIFKTKEQHDDFLKFIKEIFPDCPIDLLPKFN